jgi:hypothetical protein
MGGFAAIMSYFATIFFRPGFGDLGWLIACILLGAACGFLIVSYVPPEHAERRLPRLVGAIRGRLIDLLGVVAGSLGRRHQDRRPDELLAAVAGRLAEAATGAQGLLADEASAAALWPGLDSERLAVAIFDLQLAAERFALVGGELASDSSAGARDTLREEVREVQHALRARDGGALDGGIAGVRAARDDLQQPPADDPAAIKARQAMSALADAAGAMANKYAIKISGTAMPACGQLISATAGRRWPSRRTRSRTGHRSCAAAPPRAPAGSLQDPGTTP